MLLFCLSIWFVTKKIVLRMFLVSLFATFVLYNIRMCVCMCVPVLSSKILSTISICYIFDEGEG